MSPSLPIFVRVQSGNATDAHGIWSLSLASTRPRASAFFVQSGSLPNNVIQSIGQAVSPFTFASALSSAQSPTIFTFEGGLLPPGLSWDPRTGTMTGAPTLTGSFAIKIVATDTRVPPSPASYSYSLTVLSAGDVLMTTDFAAPLSSAWLLRGAATAAADSDGPFLQLSAGTAGSSGSAEYRSAFNVSAGLDIRFVVAHYNGTGGDGLTLYLRDGNSTSTRVASSLGGGLSYAPQSQGLSVLSGLSDALLAVAASVDGSFAGDSNYGGADCGGDGTNALSTLPQSLVVRGGATNSDATAGFCRVGAAAMGNSYFSGAVLQNRSLRSRAIRVVLDAPSAAASRMLRVFVTDSGNFRLQRQIIAINVSSSPSLSALVAASSVYIGVAASGGSGTNSHSVCNVEVSKLSATSTSRDSRAAGTTWQADTFRTGWRNAAASVWRIGSVSSAAAVETNDVDGSYLQLTSTINSYAYMELQAPVPLSHGLDIRFVQAQVSVNERHESCIAVHGI